MACLNELDLTACTVHCAEDAIDAVTGITEHAADAPGVETGNDKIADGLCHIDASWVTSKTDLQQTLASGCWFRNSAGSLLLRRTDLERFDPDALSVGRRDPITVHRQRNFGRKPQFSMRQISYHLRRYTMPQGDKSAYTDKQKRKAEHIEESYEDRGVSESEAE